MAKETAPEKPVAPIEPTPKTFADTVREIMTVPPETTEAELIELLKGKVEMACKADAMKQESATAVALSQSATAQATEAQTQIKILSQTVDGQAEKIKTLSQQVAQNEAEKWADVYILSQDNRRLYPAQKPAFVALYLADKTNAQAIVETLPKLHALDQGTGIGGKPEGAQTLEQKRAATYAHELTQNKATPAAAARAAAAITE